MSSQPGKQLILKACLYAEEAHRGQTRGDGVSTAFAHAVRVAMLIAEHGGDDITIAAGLLHDVVEDTNRLLEDIRREFGNDVADTVHGLTDIPGWDSLPLEARKVKQASRVRDESARVKLAKLSDQTDNVESLLTSPPTAWDAAMRREYAEGAWEVAYECRTMSPKLWTRFVTAFQAVNQRYPKVVEV